MRIRTIKPEFWRSNDISDLDPFDRLLYIGLWSYVDDNGVGIDELHIIIAEIFARDHFEDPRETVARVSRGLQNIATNGLITRYHTSGKAYLYVNEWDKHQRIDKPNKPRHPRPDTDRDTLATPSRVSRDTLAPGTEEQRNRGTEEQGVKTLRADAPAPTALIPLEPQPTFDDFWAVYPRKADKATARKAWTKATKTAAPADVIAGAASYAADPNREPAFTKHPAPWLNAEAWNNEPLPTRTPTPTTETPTERITRMRNAALAGLTQGENDGNPDGMHRPAHGTLSA